MRKQIHLATLIASAVFTTVSFAQADRASGDTPLQPPRAVSPANTNAASSTDPPSTQEMQQIAAWLQQTEAWLQQADTHIRNERPQQASELLRRSSEQVRQAMQKADGWHQQELQSLYQQIMEARQLVAENNPQAMERLAQARATGSQFNADIVARLGVDVPPPRVTVDQADPTVRVDQASPLVRVDPGRPQVAVLQPAPQVHVQMPQPTITINMPPPQIRVSIPDPAVAVQMQRPEVTVTQAKPTVQVDQGKPEIRLGGAVDPTADAKAKVVVKPGDPEVLVSPAEARVRVMESKPLVTYQAVDPVVIVKSDGEPKIQFSPSGEPEVTIRQMTAEETRQVASTPPAGDEQR